MLSGKALPILILLAFSVFLTKNVKANIDYNDNCKKAYEYVLSFNFDKVDSILQVEKRKHPDNSVVETIKSSSSFLRYINSNRKEDLKLYYSDYETAIDKIDQESDGSPYKLYFLADLYLHSAFVNAMQSNFFTSIVHFKKAYNSIKENKKKFPKFVLNDKSLGLINIAIGSIPKSYNWTLTILNLKGNSKLGNTQLEQFLTNCIQKKEYNYLFVESVVLYSFTHNSFASKNDTNNILSSIYHDPHYTNLYKNNQSFAYSKAAYFQHLKQNDNTLKTLRSIQNEFLQNKYKLYYLDYMLGECLLFKNDNTSITYFDRYISDYPGENYLKSATYKKSWAYLLEGDIDSYKAELGKIDDIGVTFFDSDKQAQKAANENITPNVEILRSRLLFDGGYYEKADSVLQQAYKNGHIKTEHDKLEYIYRQARIYDEMGKHKVAEAYYKMAIKKGSELPYYFAANSALNLAFYYEENGQLEKAKTMYQLCLDLDFDEYQNSITQKAKNGISRIEACQE
jgi:hypothetical protein